MAKFQSRELQSMDSAVGIFEILANALSHAKMDAVRVHPTHQANSDTI